MAKGTAVFTSPGEIAAGLLALAPLDLKNYRADRYQGESVAVDLNTLAPADQEIVRGVYEQINHLLEILSIPMGTGAASRAVHQFVHASAFSRLRADLRQLGHATFVSGRHHGLIGKAIHDIRGGALSALLMRLEIFDGAPLSRKDLRTLFMLTRDHGKIMRSALTDLDGARRRGDKLPQSHHVSLLLEKWSGAIVNQDNARLQVDCRFAGAVTENCLESAAIDRVFHNLVANAVRHNAGAQLDLDVFQVPHDPGRNLRFVLRNDLDTAGRQRLGELVGGGGDVPGLGYLFEPGVSTTGSGLGLAIVADLVTQAFGVASEEEALRAGYFGACLLEGRFTVWFHWPIARDDLGTVTSVDATEKIPAELPKAL